MEYTVDLESTALNRLRVQIPLSVPDNAGVVEMEIHRRLKISRPRGLRVRVSPPVPIYTLKAERHRTGTPRSEKSQNTKTYQSVI